MRRAKTLQKNPTTKSSLQTIGGTAAGAAIGSLMGPVGAAVGAVVGGIAGANAHEIANSKSVKRVTTAANGKLSKTPAKKVPARSGATRKKSARKK